MNDERFASFVERCQDVKPKVFLVLGSGLSQVSQRVEKLASVPFADIPGLSSSTVVGHRGEWTIGSWGRCPVLVSDGRIHYYEGHTWDTVTSPVRLAAKLGVRVCLLTNAAGGIRDDLCPGELMPIRDHLEWNRPNPWLHYANTSPYSEQLITLILSSAKDLGFSLGPGIYGAVTGPSYETPAEIRALKAAGADAVGMSTSREVLAGVAAGMECAAVSMITNRAAGLTDARLTHEEVMATGKSAAGRLADLIDSVLNRLS